MLKEKDMTRKFYNKSIDVLVIINETNDGATTAILGDEEKVSDDTIFALYKGFDLVGWSSAP